MVIPTTGKAGTMQRVYKDRALSNYVQSLLKQPLPAWTLSGSVGFSVLPSSTSSSFVKKFLVVLHDESGRSFTSTKRLKHR
jgi:hypothetical protein